MSQTSVSQSPKSMISSSPPKSNASYYSNKEKKILPGRRQQRHSTEIGSEYHRWWVVRNALGFETNEHIAGLLLDGFHGLLHQLVQMCGGQSYHPVLHGAAKENPDFSDSSDDKVSLFSASPPGVIEDMEEFTEYKNAVTYYCDTLWKNYSQQDSRLHKLQGESQPVEEFLGKLMSYLRTARGKSFTLGQKKKKLKPICVSSKNTCEKALETSSKASGIPAPPIPDPSHKETSSLTVLSPPNGQGVNEPDWVHGQLAPSPQSGKYKYTALSKSEPDKESCSQDVHFDAQENDIDSVNPVSSCNKMNPKDNTSRQSISIEGQMGFQQLRSKNTDSSEHNIHPVDESSLQSNGYQVNQEAGTELAADKGSKFKWLHLNSSCDSRSSKIDESCNSYNRNGGTVNVTPESFWNRESQISVEAQDSCESDYSNDEDLAAGLQYEEQYLKQLLSQSTNSYSAQHLLVDIPEIHSISQTIKEPPNHVQKVDSQQFILEHKKCNILIDNDKKHFDEKEEVGNLVKKNISGSFLPNPPQDLSYQVGGQANLAHSLKHKNSLTTSVGTNTFDSFTQKNGSSMPQTKMSQKISGREKLPALTVALEKSQDMPTPCGTPIIFYPANSFSTSDTSLASLSSLVQNIVCNSHSAVLKPLSLASVSTSSTQSQHISHSISGTSPADGNSLGKSMAATLPVLTSQLSADKPTLVPFYTNHMNSLSAPPRYPDLPSNCHLRPANPPGLRPIKPYLPLALTQPQVPIPKIYSTPWSISQKNVPATQLLCGQHQYADVTSRSKADSTSHNSSIKSTKLSSSSSTEPANYLLKMFSQNPSIAVGSNDILQEKHTGLNRSQLTKQIFSNHSFLPLSQVQNHEECSLQSANCRKQKKKILTSLLSSKAIHYNSSNILNTSNVTSDQSVSQDTLLCERHDTYSHPSSSVSVTAIGLDGAGLKKEEQRESAENSDSVTACKKRCDKSSLRCLVCSTCDLMFYSETDLLVHRYEQHSHVCGECDGRFLSLARLKQHKESDHPVMIRCSLCRFHTFVKQELLDHQRLEHGIKMDSTGDKMELKDITLSLYKTEIKPISSTQGLMQRNADNTPEKKGDTDFFLNGDTKTINKISFPTPSVVCDQKPREPSSKISDGREHCLSQSNVTSQVGEELNPSLEQLFSETDEPKLVIDTDVCSSSKEENSDGKSDNKASPCVPTLSGQLKESGNQPCLSRKRLFLIERKKSRLSRLRGSQMDQILRQLRPRNDQGSSVAETCQPTNQLREKLMKICLKRSRNQLYDRPVFVKKKYKRIKIDERLPLAAERDEKSTETISAGEFDTDLKLPATSLCSDQCASIQSVQCKDVTSDKIIAHEMENKQTNSVVTLGTIDPAPLGSQFPTVTISTENKFVSLHERLVMSSLPPKKRRLRKALRSFKCDKDIVRERHCMTTDGNNDVASDKLHLNMVQENSNQHKEPLDPVTSSIKAPETALLLRPLVHHYLCPMTNCGATFSRKWNLDAHISRVHTKLTSITCPMAGCQKLFSTKRELHQHSTIDHKGKTRKYKCNWPECNKSFFAHTHLRIHILTHTGEKPVSCHVCDYRCRQRTALMWHMRKHKLNTNEQNN